LKISIILPNLAGGGAEKLAVYLANDWTLRGQKVELVLMKNEGEFLPLIPPSIDVFTLNVERLRSSIWPLRQYLVRNQPDVIWASMWPLTSVAVVAWLLAWRPGKIFLTDHIHLSISCSRELGLPLLALKSIMKMTYPLATGVTAVSKGVAADMTKLSGLSEDRIRVIYNPAAVGIPVKPVSTDVSKDLWGKGFNHRILSVGSFKLQKNHSLLISAFAKLPVELNAKLTILGEGGLRSSMERQIAELGLGNKISLPGFFKDPYPWFLSADLFVLSSDWEGFGNVIVEALECGVPVVCTDCPSGPSEILEAGRYGILVPVGDADAMAIAIKESLSQEHDRKALMNRAREFSIVRISDSYLDYFGLPLSV